MRFRPIGIAGCSPVRVGRRPPSSQADGATAFGRPWRRLRRTRSKENSTRPDHRTGEAGLVSAIAG